MTGSHVTILAVVCILGGVALGIFREGDPMAMMLAVAGTGVLAGNVVHAKQETKRQERKAKKVQEALDRQFETTQMLREQRDTLARSIKVREQVREQEERGE